MNRQTQDHPSVVAFPPLIFIVPLIVSLVFQFIAPLPFLSGIWPSLLGWPILGLGLSLAVWGNQTMKQAGTNVNPYEPATAIVTDGPFRFSRNPLYISLTLIYLGITFLTNALWALMVLPFVLLVIQRGVIVREEAYLERKFGRAYLDYKSQVRRWI